MAAKENLVRRIVREVNRFDNFYFEIHNEPFWNQPGVRDAEEVEFHDRMLAVIREEEAALENQHLVAHNFPQHADELSGDFGIINEHYPGMVPGSTIAGAEALLRDHYFRGKILAMGEADTRTEPQARLEAWMFLLGGGAIYQGLAFTNVLYTSDDEAGDNALGNAVRGSIRNAGRYIDGLHLVSLRRDLTWIQSAIPAGATVQAMANPGQQYVAYFHHGQSGLVNFQTVYNPIDTADHTAAPVVQLEAGSWRAVWTRPSDMAVLGTEEFNHNGGVYTLAPMIYQADVALRIDRTGDGDATPPPSPGGLAAVPEANGTVHLSWNAPAAADLAFYRIYRAESAGVPVAAEGMIGELPATVMELTDSSAALGTPYFYTVTAVDMNGNESTPSDEAGATPALRNAPFGGTTRGIPGVIQAEDFDLGGQDIAYHDLTPENEWGQYRELEGVDIETRDNENGVVHVVSTVAGEWLEYSVRVAAAGVYRLDLRTSGSTVGGEVLLEIDGVNISGPITIPEAVTEGEWHIVTVPEIVLPAGERILRLVISGNSGAIDWFEFTPVIKTGPAANAGADQEIADIDSDGFGLVRFDAGGSTAGDAPISTHTWKLGSTQLATGITPEIQLPLGEHIIVLTVTDTNGLSSTDEVAVRVIPAEFVNGSFEAGLSGWTTTGNMAIPTGGSYAPTHGSKLLAFNYGQAAPNGILSQTFATTPGLTYQLAFDMGVLAFNDSPQTLQVQVTGGSTLVSQSYVTRRINGVKVRWDSKSLLFTADSNSSTLVFRDLSSVTDSLDLTLDNIRIIPQISRALVVESSPATGAAITISPADNSGLGNGTTGFTRRYAHAVAVNLSAPSVHNGYSFSKWRKNGHDLTNSTNASVVMDADHTLTAVYIEGLPVITAQPGNLAVAAGGSATFRVTATAFGTLAYQWRFNGADLTGEHTDTLVISDVQTAKAGSYDVIVSNVVGSVTSSSAVLTVLAPPDTAFLVNGSFEAGFDGWTATGNMVIQSGGSYVATDGTRLVAFNGGQTTPNGILSQAFATIPGQIYQLAFDMGVYALNDSQQRLQVQLTGSSSLISQTYVTNRLNGIKVRWESKSLQFTANSSITTLVFRDVSTVTNSLDLTLDRVRIVPQISRRLIVRSTPVTGAAVSVSPADGSGLGNGTADFTRLYPNAATVNLTAAATNGALRFQKWQKNGVDHAATQATSVVMDGDHTFTAVYVEGPPVILTQPANVAIAAGGSATFRVTATSSAPVSYQWRFNGSPLPGTNSDTLSITNAQPANTGSYDVIVSNTAGPVISNPANLVIPSAISLANGSFEAGFDGWTVTGNVQIRNSVAPYSATNGTRIAAFNTSNGQPNGVVSRSIATTPGASYVLAFDVGVLAYNTLPQQLQMTCTGQAVLLSRNVVVTGPGNGTTRWFPQSFTFVADSATTVMAFRDISATTNAIDLLLDHVRLNGTSSIAAAIPPAEIRAVSRQLLGPAFLIGTYGNHKVGLLAPSTGTYVLEKSENLLNWERIDTLQAAGPGMIEFTKISPTDALIGHPVKSVFYRVVRLPDIASE